MRAVGYGRCSTREQASEGVSMVAQKRAVKKAANARDMELCWIEDPGVSGKVKPEDRKGFKTALTMLENKQADVLIFTKVDRACRRTEDFARLMRLAEEQGWEIVVTDLGIDTRTPMGRAMGHVAVVFAELEAGFISQRTRDALQVKKDQGVQLGRKSNVPEDVLARIIRERAEGKGYFAIARDLTRDGVPTAQGAATWAPNTVRSVLKREGAE